ncbi:MAG: amino acid adenylation domain-containing protein [Ruminococcus sp.]|nr:amino acid adenylation domain-containing protein [Ruminococcus sp.]
MHYIIEKNSHFPMTNLQKAYYIGQNSGFEAGGTQTYVYHEFENSFTHEKFEKAFNRLIDCQPMLRAVFRNVSEQEIISVEDYGIYRVKNYDFSCCSNSEQEEKIKEIRSEILDLIRSGKELFVFRTAELNSGKLLIFSGCNLLVADAFSLCFVMLKELKEEYEHSGKNITENCPLSFSDYVNMKEQEKQTETYKKDKEFWLERIAEIPPAPDINIRTEKLKNKAVGKRLKYVLDKNILQRIRINSKKHRMTPTVAVMSAYAMVLGMWSNQESFSLNVPVMDRPFNPAKNIDFSNVIGDFTSVRIISVQNRIFSGMNFWNYSENVKSAVRTASRHKTYDGTEIIREIAKVRNTPNKAIMPYVFTSMILGNDAYDSISAFGKINYSVSQTPQVFIDCQVIEENGELNVTWDYNAELFDDDVISFMFSKFCRLLESIDQEGIVPEDFFALSQKDDEILAEYNNTSRNFPSVTAIPMIEESFRRYAGKTAVRDSENSLTYYQLEMLSDEMANHLHENNIHKGDVVAVHSERTVWTIVNILAVLKCGASFVNINTDYPENRRNYILEKSKAKLFIDSEYIKNKTPEECRKFDSCHETDEDALAYSIFTSGSTGTPKGVAITHKGLCNTIIDINERFQVNTSDKLLCVTSFCFDLSIYDIFGALAAGAEFYIARDSRDVDNLIQIIENEKITVLNCVPAITNLIVSRYEIKNKMNKNDSMRLFMMSGDWIPVSLPGKIKEYFPESISISLGGATEGSIWSICHVITEEDSEKSSIPYGKPLCNQTMHILNDSLLPCPVNTTGEIYIGGYGVAAGYLNDPEKTEKSFIETEKFGRLYKTGDFGRIHENGVMEFLGRRDLQVKIHGHRIELSEIENVLVRYKEIKNAVADVKKSENGAVYLCVYYTSPVWYTKEELSGFLSRYLTKYMVPEFYICIENIPLTANGKINRKALPFPDIKASDISYEDNIFSDTEEKLISIWSEILHTEKSSVDIHTGFFNLGGDSVNMIQATGEIEKIFGISISFQRFLQHSSIKEVAAMIDEEKAVSVSETEETSFMIQPESKYEPFPLSELQESYFIGRNADGYQGLVTNGYVELECSDYNRQKFENVLGKLIARHDMLRTVIYPDGTQQIIPEAEFPEIETVDKGNISEEELENYCKKVRREMTLIRLNLEKPPLIKIAVTTIGKRRAIIHIYVDGLIIDGWSYQIFHLELEKLYHDEMQELPTLTASYRDYVLYKEYQKTTRKYQNAKSYWLSRIPNLPEAGTLPLLSDFNNLDTIEGGQVKCGLNIDDWHKLEEKSRIFGISPFIVIFTSFALTIARWNKKQRFLLNIPEFDRPQFHNDVDHIIGVCSSFLLFTVENNPSDSFFDIVRKNHEQLWKLKENNSFSGMEVLREIYKDMKTYESALVPIVFGMMANVEIPENRVMSVRYQENHTTQIWIDITTTLYPDRIEFNWNYIKGLMDRKMLEKMVAVQEEILHRAIYEENFWEFPCQPSLPEEDMNIIQKLNDTERPFVFTSFQELIAESFEKYGDKLYIAEENRTLTYGELKNYVLGMAQKLRESGCRKNDYICIHTKKGIEQIVSIIAVLYIGAVYAPLEYHYSKALTVNCMKNMKAKYLITDSDFSEFSEEIHVIRNGLFLSESETEPEKTDENALVAIIHTSGTTGMPKAVRITQKGLLNSILFTNNKLNINSGDTFIGLENYAHDMSMYDIFGSLFSGASLALPVEEKAKDPEQWEILINKYHVTVWNSVPAFLQMIIEHNNGMIPQCMESVRVIISGGDYLNLKTACILKQNIPGLHLINVGGPTETTLWNIGHEVTDDDLKNNLIPYGRPIDNTKYYILNDNMELCPLNVKGTMYCAGIGVSAGYINRHDENFRRFVIWEKTGELLYNTGDSGRYSENGDIIFMGRTDSQVEISGKRIELHGIDKTIILHEKVQNCVSVVTEDKNNIATYYVASEKIEKEEFTEFLSDKLPYFEIPKFYIQVDEIPLTYNGKINYQALPKPDMKQEENKASENVPRDELEKLLLETYSEMLGTSADLNTDFFEMGGTSLMAVKMVTKIRSELDIPLSLTEMFSVLTISELHDLIQKKINEKENSRNEN